MCHDGVAAARPACWLGGEAFLDVREESDQRRESCVGLCCTRLELWTGPFYVPRRQLRSRLATLVFCCKAPCVLLRLGCRDGKRSGGMQRLENAAAVVALAAQRAAAAALRGKNDRVPAALYFCDNASGSLSPWRHLWHLLGLPCAVQGFRNPDHSNSAQNAARRRRQHADEGADRSAAPAGVGDRGR